MQHEDDTYTQLTQRYQVDKQCPGQASMLSQLMLAVLLCSRWPAEAN